MNNNISEANNLKESKSKKACQFFQFSNETRAGNISLHHMLNGLTSMRELRMEHKHGLNDGEPSIELDLRA